MCPTYDARRESATTMPTQFDRSSHTRPVPERRAVGISEESSRGTRTGERSSQSARHDSMSCVAVDVFELIRNAVLLATVHCDEAQEDTSVTMGFHYSGKWIVSRALVVDILPRAIQNALMYAETLIHISTRLERPGVTAFQRTSVLVIEINDDGPEFAQSTYDSVAAASALGLESVAVKHGGILNGPLLQIRVPLDRNLALQELPEIAIAR